MAATEVSFAKTFLSLLDTKPTKITADHVEDAKGYPATTPFTLPFPPSQRPFRRSSKTKSASPAPGSTPSDSVPVRLTSARNPVLSLSLPPLPASTTSVLDLKDAVHKETNIPVEKLKLLYNKKPVGDSKTIKDALGGTSAEGAVEFTIMVIGGEATYKAAQEEREAQEQAKGSSGAESVAQGLSGEGVLGTEEFWDDLQGFLQQRVRDEKVAGEATEVFRGAWKGRS